MARILSALETLPVIDALRRSRSRWRILAFVALAALFLVMGMRMIGGTGAGGPAIARVSVDGIMTTSPSRLKVLADLKDNDNVKAVLVEINSPGGTSASGEELYEALRDLAEKKPVVAVIDELGASAAYMTAVGADRIFARRLSLVGSIGAYIQHVDAGGLLRTIGVDLDKVQSGPLKAEPDLDDPLAGDVRQSLQTVVDDTFNWFVDVVADRRNLDRDTVLPLADGRIMTGRMALDAGLIDDIGGEAQAVAWLESDRGIDKDLTVRTYFPLPENDLERLTRFIGSEAQQALGLSSGGIVPLDGMVSLWHANP
ncbi:MAG: signal peptide peptidase SppA [Hyphomicrobiaceae bacterium]|nr:signal peptide peptidase SppA [Hyphomicrobiaceae bacterium]